MSAVVIDASAGAEIVADTRRGRALARLIPRDSEGWVPEHFYAEVGGTLRRWVVIQRSLPEAKAQEALSGLEAWKLRRAGVASLLKAAWPYRHNMTIADALYVALAEHLQAAFLTDDHNLVGAPTFPETVRVLRLSARL